MAEQSSPTIWTLSPQIRCLVFWVRSNSPNIVPWGQYLAWGQCWPSAFVFKKAIFENQATGMSSLAPRQISSLTVYKTLILPIINYCNYIYLGTSAHDQETLQKFQNHVFHYTECWQICTNKGHTYFSKMEMLNSRREKHAEIQIYKFINQLGPESCGNMFMLQDHHELNTMNWASKKSTFILPRLNLSLSQRNIRYFGVKIWSKIPEDIKTWCIQGTDLQ